MLSLVIASIYSYVDAILPVFDSSFKMTWPGAYRVQQLLADQELTVVSVNEEIIIDAKQRIEVFDGERIAGAGLTSAFARPARRS